MAGAAVVLLAPGVQVPPAGLLLFFGVLIIPAEIIRIPLPRGGFQTLGPVVSLPMIALLGPVPAACLAATGVAIGDGFLHRRPVTTAAFNVGQRVLSILLAGFVWTSLLWGQTAWTAQRRDDPAGHPILPAILGALLTYAVVNMVLVSLRLATRRGQSLWTVLRSNGAWQGPMNIGIGASGLAIALLATGRPSTLDVGSLVSMLIAAFVVLQYTARRQVVRDFEDLHGAVSALLQTLDPQELLNRLADRVQHLAAPDIFLILLDGTDGTRQVALARGVDPTACAPLLRGATEMIGWADANRCALRIVDCTKDPRWTPPDQTAADGVRSMLIIPMHAGGEMFGTLLLTTPMPDYFTVYQERMIMTLATQAALAVTNAKLYTEIHQRRDELQGLYESSQALSASLEVSSVAEALVSVTCRRFGYDHGAILLPDVHGNLVVRAAYGDSASVGQRVPAGRGLEGRVVSEGRAMVVPDVTKASSETALHQPAGGVIAVPLLRENRVMGVFTVGAARGGALGERDQRLITMLAAYGAVAIENARLYEQTRDLAITDGLTGLRNYRAFQQALEREMERCKRFALPLSLIMIEIDTFKRYNDTYGHQRGDEVLRMLARVLDREHRTHIDVAARYGGDEFVLLLPHTLMPDAAAAAERIRRAVETTPLVVGTEVASVTLSLGVAAYPEDGQSVYELVEAADRRMYVAKRSGGNSVVLTASP